MPPEATPTKTIIMLNGDPEYCLLFTDEATAKCWVWINSCRFSSMEMFTVKPGGQFIGGAQPTPYATSKSARAVL